MKPYHKLIRDKVPQIIEADGEIPTIRILDDKEYKEALLKKLAEEAVEAVRTQGNPQRLAKEMADVLEVLDCLEAAFGLKRGEIETLQKERRESRGGFEKRIFLEHTVFAKGKEPASSPAEKFTVKPVPVPKRPSVGVGLIVVKGQRVLVQRRRNAHGDGTWSFGGGHLEFGENWEDCARREAQEEHGVQIKNLRLATVTNDVFREEGKHYVTLFVVGEHESGEPELREPEWGGEWKWVEWDDLPRPLFLPIENLLRTGFRPF